MWGEVLMYHKTLQSSLNMDIELHFAIYMYHILMNTFEFTVKNNTLKIKNKSKVITENEFIFWIQYTLYNELVKEDPIFTQNIMEIIQSLINRLHNVKKKRDNTSKYNPHDCDLFTKEINSIENKIKEHEGNHFHLIKGFKIMIEKRLNTNESVTKLLNNIKLYIQCDK
tara:strand:- start:611 stop:1117 length:507 start_codon:yes stop_codon:yes gene_type:complete